MSNANRRLCFHIVAGVFIGILFLHPVTKAIYWFEFRDQFKTDATLWRFLLERLQSTFLVEMIPMNLVFGTMGGLLGTIFGLLDLKLAVQKQTLNQLENELARDTSSLIVAGENKQAEFKSSVRWDLRQSRINKALELVIAKTIAGFMNHLGGNLLIGVDDDGHVLGLEYDYQTLKIKNRDGFEQCIMQIVKSKLGGHNCSLVHVIFCQIEGNDVCRIIVEASNTPVFCRDGDTERFYLRAGNGTRELDARELVAHLNVR